MKQLLILILMFVSFQAFGQVTGTVYDGETNETLPGASVRVKGTTVGVSTDMTGKYSLQASIGDILLFSFVGYESREITVTDLSLDVELFPSTNILNEVVVVGYGVQKKSDITGSVVSITADKLKERPQVNLTQSLQGSMAGLSVNVRGSDAEGTSSFLMIRGQNSITASNTPLIILDGVPFSGALSEINSSDIESFEILKDASSTAIYGSRGANGVILITTKKGIKGRPVITYDAYYRMDMIAHIPDMMDGETFAAAKMEYGEPLSATEQRNLDNGDYTDWIDLATQNGGAAQHNLSIRGATDKVNYFVSAGINDVKGIAKEDMFKRASLRTNLEIKLTDWLRYGTNTQFGYYDRSGIQADFQGAFEMNPLGDAYNEDGTYTLITWEDAFYADNPLSPLYADSNNRTWRVSTNNYIELDLPFIEGLTYKLNTGYDFRNRFFQRYYGTNTQRGAEVGGELFYSHTYDIDWLVENIISYNKTFGKHTLFLTGLYSAQQKTWEFNSVEATGFSSDLLSYYQPGNSVSPLPGADYSKRSYISQMFRANYSYDSRYLFTFTVRRDGFSGFGENTKFGVFPSVALGWNITNEKFFKSITSLDFVSNLKLRLSYGENGNEAIAPYSTLPALSSHNYLDESYTPVLGYYPMQLGNPLLGWETSKSTNLGIDFSLWENRLSGLVDVYWTNTYDLLLDKSISPVNGTSSIRENIGQTHNNGIEFQLSSVNISRSDFVWRTDLNFTHYNTKIVHVGLTDEEGNYIDDIANEWFIGENIDVYYNYVMTGLWQQADFDNPDIPESLKTGNQPGFAMYLDGDDDGDIDVDDKRIIGRRIPKFSAGMTNSFKYKNFSFSFFLNSVIGIDSYNALLESTSISYRENTYNLDFWTPDHTNGTIPVNTPSSNSRGANFYEDASFVRLQDVTFGYSFDSNIIEKLKLSNAELYVNLKNMVTWTNWIGLDPEFIGSTSVQKAIPQTRSYLFGIRVSF